MIRHFSKVLRRFGSQEDVFKQYLRQAESIEKKAQQKAEEVKNKTIQSLSYDFDSKDPVIEYIRNSKVISKLSSAKSSERVQVCLEEVLYDASKLHKQDQSKPSPGSVIEKLLILWDERPELKLIDSPLAGYLRTIWISPFTEVSEDFGEFRRITKDETTKVSPFFCGHFNDVMYTSLIKGAGGVKTGVKIIRKVVDHIAAQQHLPGGELSQAIVDECIAGKWPNTMLVFLKYCHGKQVKVPLEVWSSAIRNLRFTNGYFDSAMECVDLAIENQKTPSWNLIEPLVNKYLKHEMNKEAEELVQKVKNAFPKSLKIGASSKEEVSKFNASLYQNYLEALVNNNQKTKAIKIAEQFIENNPKTEETVMLGFDFYEKLGDSSQGKEYYNQVISDKKIQFTAKMVAGALKMALKLGKDATTITEEQETVVFTRKDLYTPFATNLIIMTYGKYRQWDKLLRVLQRLRDSDFRVNKFAKPAVDKQIKRCLEPLFKRKMNEALSAIKFPE